MHPFHQPGINNQLRRQQESKAVDVDHVIHGSGGCPGCGRFDATCDDPESAYCASCIYNIRLEMETERQDELDWED